MTIPNASRSTDSTTGSVTLTDDPIPVVITRRDAPIVADHLAGELRGWLGDAATEQPTGQGDLDALRAVIDRFSGYLDQIAWGRPKTDVTLTMPRGELEHLASELISLAADQGPYRGPDGLAESRRHVQPAVVGASIADQLEATR